MDMMSDNPLVSVIIPVYNCELYLREAVESVLAQTSSRLEIIVVDDSSTDGSANVARSFGECVRYVRQEHGGIGAARNRGVVMARGELLAFLDADDIWMPDKLELQLGALRFRNAPDMVFGQVEQFVSPELDEDEQRKLHCPSETAAGYHPGAMLIRRCSFMAVGQFAVNLQVGEFIDWYARAVDKGLTGAVLPDTVLRRRIHLANTTIRQRAAQTDYLKVLKASLDRRRALSAGASR
jgi:glycosyltransferase involved in cell wall biosynthesis